MHETHAQKLGLVEDGRALRMASVGCSTHPHNQQSTSPPLPSASMMQTPSQETGPGKANGHSGERERSSGQTSKQQSKGSAWGHSGGQGSNQTLETPVGWPPPVRIDRRPWLAWVGSGLGWVELVGWVGLGWLRGAGNLERAEKVGGAA
jgi:hypothetical protein